MIKQLRINNFLLIKDAEIDFDQKFNVITGESGSGKSLILKAIRFCLGQKVNKSYIGHWSDRSVVEMEVIIDLPKGIPSCQTLRSNNGIYVISRELRDKSSHCYINSKKVSKEILSQLVPYILLDCQQSQATKLLNSGFQLSLIDEHIDQQLLADFNAAQGAHQCLKKRQVEIQGILTSIEDEAFIQSQIKDFSSLPEESYEDLMASLDQHKSLQRLADSWGEDSMTLRSSIKACQRIKQIQLSECVLEQIEGVEVAIEALEREVEACLEEHSESLYQINHIKQKLSLYNDMGRKHRVMPRDLHQTLQSLHEQQSASISANEERELVAAKLAEAAQHHSQLYDALVARRYEQSELLSQQINQQLVLLGMEQAVFKVSWKNDLPQFEIQSNPGQIFKAIGECLSGGELSRLHLLMMVYIGDARAWILDEIDTGVSGVTGFRVRELIEQVAQTRQVLCISHLAQVSAGGHKHFKVEKQTKNEQAVSVIVPLSVSERYQELARLMCGIVDNDTINNAKQLLEPSCLHSHLHDKHCVRYDVES